MAESTHQLTPAIAIHPGEILGDELEARSIKQRDFATQLDMSPPQLNEIIKGKRNITAEFAVLLEAALDINARYWMELQSNYELDRIKLNKVAREKAALVQRWNIIKEYVPIGFFKKQNLLRDDIKQDENKIKEIYSALSIDDIISQVSKPCYNRFRKSEKFSTNIVHLVGWIKLVEYKASKKKVGTFSQKEKDSLIAKLKKIFLTKNVIENSEMVLSEYGIKLVIQEKPDQTPIDGMAFWSKKNPAIGLSLRYKRIDNFAFTLLHELGHIYKHLAKIKEGEFVDDLENRKFNNETAEEVEANLFAQINLIPEEKWEDFLSKNYSFEDSSIKSFAEEIQLHPAIVRGRLCYENILNYGTRTSIPYSIQ